MLRVSGVSAPLDYDFGDIKRLAAEALRRPEQEILSVRLVKKSVDARDKSDVRFVVSFDVELKGGDKGVRPDGRGGVKIEPREIRPAYSPPSSSRTAARRPLVVGFGPAGMFAAYILALGGLCPIVVERGREVEVRAADIARLRSSGTLDPGSNVQFGEGGAGAFSDGKLTTGISDPRCAYVLETFVRFGAPEEIMYLGKPHIGTDRLPGVVRAMRKEIIALGGEVRFETRLDRLIIDSGRVIGASIARGVDAAEYDAEHIILAVGHSARDTFYMMRESGVAIERKPFAIGARIEHPQRMIDLSQYGRSAGQGGLGAAEYKLSCHLPGGRSAYTFCMCPGGEVVAAASEPGGVVTNGMSSFARDGVNANSALLVGVSAQDFPGEDPLAGLEFQRKWERAAYELGGGGYVAPAQRVGDFLRGFSGSGEGDVAPSYVPGVRYADLSSCLPEFVCGAMRQAIPIFGRKISGFDASGALLTGVETRSSSPVRIPRGADYLSSVAGLYPCGEGAGYAGGIMSAAVDGIRCAEAVISSISQG